MALCEGCKELRVVDLADVRPERRDPRCEQCHGLLKLLEGIVQELGCPRCGKGLRHSILGSWV